MEYNILYIIIAKALMNEVPIRHLRAGYNQLVGLFYEKNTFLNWLINDINNFITFYDEK